MYQPIQNPKSIIQNQEIGRVLRSSTTGFAIGSRVNQLSEPSFGCLVKAQPIGREVVYGIVYDIHIDDDQLIQRLVMTENPRPEVIEDQRQNRMLPLEISALAIGYKIDGVLRHGLPPRPPLNLDPVYLCVEQNELIEFTNPSPRGTLSYLRLILRAPNARIPIDQLLVAHVVETYQRRGEDMAWAMKAVAEIIELLRNNYELLVPTLEALSDAMPELDASGMVF